MSDKLGEASTAVVEYILDLLHDETTELTIDKIGKDVETILREFI